MSWKPDQSSPNPISSKTESPQPSCTPTSSARSAVGPQQIWSLPKFRTWNLKMAPWNRRFLLWTSILRFNVKLQGKWKIYQSQPLGPPRNCCTAARAHDLSMALAEHDDIHQLRAQHFIQPCIPALVSEKFSCSSKRVCEAPPRFCFSPIESLLI